MFKINFIFSVIFIFSSFAPTVKAKKWGKCSWNTKKIVDKADRIMFAKTTAGKMVMKVKKSDYSSTIKMKFYSKGREKMLVKIYSPSRLKGMSTLKVNNKVWYYMPRTDRIVKVNSSMMSSSWMGSHVTNDDLVKETQLQKHYICHSNKSDKTHHYITLKPKPSAPVVWGKIVMKIRKKDNIPVSSKYYSEKNKLERTMTFSDIREIDGRKIPAKMRLSPAGKNEYTEIYYKKIRFNVSIPGRYFTLRGLKR